MSKDSVDMIKAVAGTALLFGLGACALLFVLNGLRTYGGALPFLGALPAARPLDTVALLTPIRPFVALGAAWLVAAGLALAIRSAYLDHLLQVFAKAIVLVVAATLGVIAGQWAYLRLTRSGDVALESLLPLAILLAVLIAIGSAVRLESLRTTPLWRYLIAAGLILAGPVLLVSVR